MNGLSLRLAGWALAGTVLAGAAQAQISASGLELRLNLDGSGQTVSDSSGNGNDCQLGSTSGADGNDPTWTSEGLQFDGGDFVDCLRTTFGGTSLFAQAAESFTVQVVALQPADATSKLLARSTGAATVFELGSQSGSGVAATLRGTSTTIENPTPTNEWHLWTVRWDGSTATGRLDHGADIDLGSGTVTESAENLAIGARSVSTGGADFLPNGSKVALVLLYDRALENSEMRRQYCAIREFAGSKSVDLADANCPAPHTTILSGTTLMGVPQRVASPGPSPAPPSVTVDVDTCDEPQYTTNDATYILTQNLDCASNGGAGNAAIQISAANITFDFNGHWLKFANDKSGIGLKIVGSGSVAIVNSASTAGTGTISSDGKTVTGSSTEFTSELAVGDLLTPTSGTYANQTRIVTQINSDTELLVSEMWGVIDTSFVSATPLASFPLDQGLAAGTTFEAHRGGVEFDDECPHGIAGSVSSSSQCVGIYISGGSITAITITNTAFRIQPSVPIVHTAVPIGLRAADLGAGQTRVWDVQNSGFWGTGPTVAGTGTITVTGDAMEGSGTAFTTQLRVGHTVRVGSTTARVESITDDDSAVLTSTNLNGTSGAAFDIPTAGAPVTAYISSGSASAGNQGGFSNNAFLTDGEMSIGASTRVPQIRFPTHWASFDSPFLFSNNALTSHVKENMNLLCDNCRWFVIRDNIVYDNGANGHMLQLDDCSDCEVFGNYFHAGTSGNGDAVHTRNVDVIDIHHNRFDMCPPGNTSVISINNSRDNIVRDNVMHLCPFGSGGINNNRVIDLESSGTDARHEVYNNDAQIEEPEGGNTFNRNFLFLYATGGSIDDVLSAYNKITRVGTASETYRFNDVTSAPELRVTNIVFCKDQTDGVEISVANAGTYVSDPGTEPADYTVDEDGTCDCEPACGPALGVRPM